MQPYAVSHETADRLLDQLTEYAVFHFQTEAPDGRQRHRQAPQRSPSRLACRLRRPRWGNARALRADRGHLGGELLTFLANWLVFHILSDDQVLGSQLIGHPQGAPGEAFERRKAKESDPALQAKTQALTISTS